MKHDHRRARVSVQKVKFTKAGKIPLCLLATERVVTTPLNAVVRSLGAARTTVLDAMSRQCPVIYYSQSKVLPDRAAPRHLEIHIDTAYLAAWLAAADPMLFAPSARSELKKIISEMRLTRRMLLSRWKHATVETVEEQAKKARVKKPSRQMRPKKVLTVTESDLRCLLAEIVLEGIRKAFDERPSLFSGDVSNRRPFQPSEIQAGLGEEEE